MNRWLQILRNAAIGPTDDKKEWIKQLKKQQGRIKTVSGPARTGMELVKAGRLLSDEIKKRTDAKILPSVQEILAFFRGKRA